MQYLLCFLTTISNPALDISLYYNFLNKCPFANYQPNQTCLSLYFYSKSTGIAFKLSKRQNTDQSTYIVIHVSQAFGSVSINIFILCFPKWHTSYLSVEVYPPLWILQTAYTHFNTCSLYPVEPPHFATSSLASFYGWLSSFLFSLGDIFRILVWRFARPGGFCKLAALQVLMESSWCAP